MSQRQQREVARSERGEIDPQARRIAREGKQADDEKGRRGKIPPENRPRPSSGEGAGQARLLREESADRFRNPG